MTKQEVEVFIYPSGVYSYTFEINGMVQAMETIRGIFDRIHASVVDAETLRIQVRPLMRVRLNRTHNVLQEYDIEEFDVSGDNHEQHRQFLSMVFASIGKELANYHIGNLRGMTISCIYPGTAFVSNLPMMDAMNKHFDSVEETAGDMDPIDIEEEIGKTISEDKYKEMGQIILRYKKMIEG
jgi:hypothetical protein